MPEPRAPEGALLQAGAVEKALPLLHTDCLWLVWGRS